MLRSNQGGSILSFVIIGGILTALLIGGAYFVQQQSAQSEDRPVATDQEPAPAPEAPADQAPVDSDKEPAPKPAPTPTPTPEKPAEPAPVADKSDREGSIATTPKPTTTEQLPETGPVQTVTTLLGIGLLTTATVAYVHSRRI